MIQVEVIGDDISNAINSLKRQCQKDGIMGALKQRTAGWKPSIRLKNKHRIAERRRKRQERRRFLAERSRGRG